MVKDMTSGRPLKLILTFAIPLLFGDLFQQIYNMVDSAIVGRFIGTDALAAVGATGSISALVIGFASGFAAGFGILVASFFGSGDYDRLRNCVANIIYLATSVTIVLTALAVPLTRPMLHWMNTPENIIDQSYHYIVIIFIGIFTSMFYNVLANILRALGDSRSPLYFLIVASFLNIVLDLLFVVVVEMGTAGVGLATVLAQALSALLCFIYMKKKMPLLHLTRKDMRPDFGLIKRLLGQGLPMAFQLSITSIGAIILQMAVNSLGSDAVAAITVGGKIQIFVFLLLSSFGLTMATFCSQNLGAGKIRRVSQGVHTCMIVSLICSVVGGVMIYFFGHHIALLFINAEEIAVLSAVKQFLRIGTFFYPVLAMMFLLRNSIQGLGYSTLAMVAGIFEMVTRAGIALGFVYRIGFDAACFAQPVSWVGATCFLLPTYYVILHGLKKRYPLLE